MLSKIRICNSFNLSKYKLYNTFFPLPQVTDMGVESLCCQVTILDKRMEEGVKRGEEAGAATSSITTSPDEETFKAGSTHYARCFSSVLQQDCGSGYAWIRIVPRSWSRIRIRMKSWMRIAHFSQNSGAVKAQNGAVEGHFKTKNESYWKIILKFWGKEVDFKFVDGNKSLIFFANLPGAC
jgi:hypothetical protein